MTWSELRTAQGQTMKRGNLPIKAFHLSNDDLMQELIMMGYATVSRYDKRPENTSTSLTSLEKLWVTY